jgi:hypothetical protein
MFAWLREHKFEAHLIAFLLMVLPPIPMYFAAQGGAEVWVYILITPVIMGNLLELWLR